MKKHFIIVLIMLFAVSEKVSAQVDLTYDSIKQLNLDYYAGKPVDSLLRVIPQSYNFIHIYGDLGTNNKAVGLAIRYQSGMMILIKPKQFLYMNQVDPNNVWNINLFKKETASYISVMHSDFKPLFGQYP